MCLRHRGEYPASLGVLRVPTADVGHSAPKLRGLFASSRAVCLFICLVACFLPRGLIISVGAARLCGCLFVCLFSADCALAPSGRHVLSTVGGIRPQVPRGRPDHFRTGVDHTVHPSSSTAPTHARTRTRHTHGSSVVATTTVRLRGLGLRCRRPDPRRARPGHICAGTGLTPATSASGLEGTAKWSAIPPTRSPKGTPSPTSGRSEPWEAPVDGGVWFSSQVGSPTWPRAEDTGGRKRAVLVPNAIARLAACKEHGRTEACGAARPKWDRPPCRMPKSRADGTACRGRRGTAGANLVLAQSWAGWAQPRQGKVQM